MLKGVNRQVVEVCHPDSTYFERVLFFVRPECSQISEAKLRSKADSYIKQTHMSEVKRADREKKRRLPSFLKFFFAGVVGALMGAVVMVSSVLI